MRTELRKNVKQSAVITIAVALSCKSLNNRRNPEPGNAGVAVPGFLGSSASTCRESGRNRFKSVPFPTESGYINSSKSTSGIYLSTRIRRCVWRRAFTPTDVQIEFSLAAEGKENPDGLSLGLIEHNSTAPIDSCRSQDS